MVRLKDRLVCLNLMLDIFQFQYGSIKRRSIINIFTSTILIFQFQYGSIKRKAKGMGGYVDLNFNSNMVRLKGNLVRSPLSSPL